MSKKYVKKDQLSHVLLRPEMYIGAVSLRLSEEYIAIQNKDLSYEIIKKDIKTSPAILRIFIEILSNAIDNYQRSVENKIPCSYIKVYIDKETGETKVVNDGDFIPIKIDETEKMYNHTLIFGNLLSGSNFDDEQDRYVSGRNGIGATACNIFSKKFTIHALDPDNKKTFEQTWTNNMRDIAEPIIGKAKTSKAYTSISYFPDFEKFGLKGYTDDIISQYMKYIIDTSILTKVKVYFNDNLIPVNNLTLYSKLFDCHTDESISFKGSNSECVLTPSKEFEMVTFVNGIFTKLGGTHLDAWSDAIFRPLLEKINKKGKPQLNIKDIKQYFRIFVIATVVNPHFESQSKYKLESPKIEASVKTADIAKIMKWSVVSDIQDIIRSKEMIVLKKSEKKKKGYVKIEGLDNANYAGTKNSHLCSLILCEGLSAKTYAVAGIEKGVYGYTGRNYNGILALGGKLLNCRNSNPSIIAKNKVITDLVQALGLQHGVDYTIEDNYKNLQYGRVILLTDADCDGIHISGLIMNFLHALFPSVLKRKEPFLVSMQTPIVRVFNKGGDILFYDENRFKDYVKKQNKTVKSKYYKGLGTTKIEDVPDTFGEKMVEYVKDDKLDESINKVFHKDFADERKKWLENYNPNPEFSLDDGGKMIEMKMSNFVNNEVIKFSHEDCKRSIPSLFDGLKQSQRKVLFSVKKRNLLYTKPSLKVAQLGGYVAEHTNYHHGEQNLYQTIVKMAQEFPGSNNIPLFYRDGQFGSRNDGGSDAASPRYIFTKMESLTPLIFREEDDVLLNYIDDDGDLVEPEFYIPIIPMILVNGCTAIGTGWSSSIPCYNPKDLIECIKIWMEYDGKVITNDEKGNITSSLFPELLPWYRGFTGKIETKDNKIITYGNITKEKNKVNITELPIGMWTNKFKEFCEDLIVEKKIKSMNNNSTVKKVNFTLTETEDGLSCNLNNLKLHSYLYTTNMVVFNEKYQLKKYNIDQIINDFCYMRYEFYKKRKQYIIKQLEKDLRFLGNKERFITEIINKKLNIMNVDENILIKELEKRGYDKENVKVDDEGEESGGGYNYLLRLPVRTLTSNQVKKIQNDILSLEKKLDYITKISEKKMWVNDLNEFEEEYEKWLKTMEIDVKLKKSKK